MRSDEFNRLALKVGLGFISQRCAPEEYDVYSLAAY
jgi:hypothetical protein